MLNSPPRQLSTFPMPSFLPPFEALVEHCRDHGIRCHADFEKKFLGFAMSGETAVYKVKWTITHEDQILQMEICLPIQPRDEKIRPLVLETLNRANYKLVLGHFSMDLYDGEIIFHLACPISEAGLEDRIIGRLFGTALATSDLYFAALMRVIYGGHTPEDAVYLADLPSHSESVSENKSSETAEKAAPVQIPMAENPLRRTRKKRRPPKSGGSSAPADPPADQGPDG